jgi:cytochrome c-type biogenesis protein CcmH/NrfG
VTEAFVHVDLDGTPLLVGRLWARTMRQFERTLELDPRYAKTHFLLGYLHLEEGNLDESLASFERSVSFSPDTAKYQQAYAAALARLP